jgi:hypothetical protein
MTDPYRAMCAELVNDLEEYGEAVVDAGVGWVDPDTRELLIRARALLDQPEPKDPTDEELMLTYAYPVAAAVGNKRGQFTTEDIEAAQLAGLRAVLAKWGHQ